MVAIKEDVAGELSEMLVEKPPVRSIETTVQ